MSDKSFDELFEELARQNDFDLSHLKNRFGVMQIPLHEGSASDDAALYPKDHTKSNINDSDAAILSPHYDTASEPNVSSVASVPEEAGLVETSVDVDEEYVKTDTSIDPVDAPEDELIENTPNIANKDNLLAKLTQIENDPNKKEVNLSVPLDDQVQDDDEDAIRAELEAELEAERFAELDAQVEAFEDIDMHDLDQESDEDFGDFGDMALTNMDGGAEDELEEVEEDALSEEVVDQVAIGPSTLVSDEPSAIYVNEPEPSESSEPGASEGGEIDETAYPDAKELNKRINNEVSMMALDINAKAMLDSISLNRIGSTNSSNSDSNSSNDVDYYDDFDEVDDIGFVEDDEDYQASIEYELEYVETGLDDTRRYFMMSQEQRLSLLERIVAFYKEAYKGLPSVESIRKGVEVLKYELGDIETLNLSNAEEPEEPISNNPDDVGFVIDEEEAPQSLAQRHKSQRDLEARRAKAMEYHGVHKRELGDLYKDYYLAWFSGDTVKQKEAAIDLLYYHNRIPYGLFILIENDAKTDHFLRVWPDGKLEDFDRITFFSYNELVRNDHKELFKKIGLGDTYDSIVKTYEKWKGAFDEEENKRLAHVAKQLEARKAAEQERLERERVEAERLAKEKALAEQAEAKRKAAELLKQKQAQENLDIAQQADLGAGGYITEIINAALSSVDASAMANIVNGRQLPSLANREDVDNYMGPFWINEAGRVVDDNLSIVNKDKVAELYALNKDIDTTTPKIKNPIDLTKLTPEQKTELNRPIKGTKETTKPSIPKDLLDGIVDPAVASGKEIGYGNLITAFVLYMSGQPCNVEDYGPRVEMAYKYFQQQDIVNKSLNVKLDRLMSVLGGMQHLSRAINAAHARINLLYDVCSRLEYENLMLIRDRIGYDSDIRNPSTLGVVSDELERTRRQMVTNLRDHMSYMRETSNPKIRNQQGRHTKNDDETDDEKDMPKD